MLSVTNFELTKTNKHMLVPWYLITSYAYYILDESLVSDGQYDAMARRLLREYDSIEHYHKHLISKDNLEAGTMLLAKEDYPLIVVDTAERLVKANVRSI